MPSMKGLPLGSKAADEPPIGEDAPLFELRPWTEVEGLTEALLVGMNGEELRLKPTLPIGLRG